VTRYSKNKLALIAASEYSKSCLKLERGISDDSDLLPSYPSCHTEKTNSYGGKLLVILFGGIGDVIISTSIIKVIKENFSVSKITFLTQFPANNIFDIDIFANLIDECVDINCSINNNLNQKSLALDLLKFADIMEQEEYDYILNLDHTVFSSCIARLCEGKNLYGLYCGINGKLICNSEAGANIWKLYHILEFRKKNTSHLLDYYYDLAGIKKRHTIFHNETGSQKNRNIVAFHLGTNWSSKRWPINKYVKLASLLSSKGIKVITLGVSNEIDIQQEFLNGLGDIRNIIPMSGKYDLPELANILHGVDLLVSSDTGPMHLSDHLGVPLVVLFGSTSHKESGPQGKKSIVITGGEKYLPCFRVECELSDYYSKCMGNIDPEDVFLEIIKVMGYE